MQSGAGTSGPPDAAARAAARELAAEARRRDRVERRAARAAERASRPDAGTPPPGVTQAIHQLRDSGRAGIGAAGEAAKAMRSLVAADFSLARSAFGRTLAMTGVAIAFGASAWLLLMTTAVVFMSTALGVGWALSLLIAALLSVAVTWWAGWRAMRYFEHTRMQATRRQLARLGIGELAEFTPGPGSPESTRAATERNAAGTAHAREGDTGVDVTPP